MKTAATFTATIYVGLKHHYDGDVIARDVPLAAIREYVDRVGLCVTVTDTQFAYTNGGEPGLIVGLINYPRFPKTPDQVRAHALALSQILLKCCRQFKVSVVMPDETVMIEAPDGAA
jgi:hypothetical protein